MELPVYLINGFLESGKTEFISYTICEDYFQIDGRTLLLVCEEGEVEYEDDVLADGNAVVEYIGDEADFTPAKLKALEKKHLPERVIIEFNGMWDPQKLRYPRNWLLEEQITLIDASTFGVYYANMKAKLADMVRGSDVVIFNRCDDLMDVLPGYRRSIRAINQACDIIFEDRYGEIDNLDAEDLPYDLAADTIRLDDENYAVWYLDAMERPDRYMGKTIEFLAMVMHQDDFPSGWFIPGRIAMVCCEKDVAFLGYPCRWAGEADLKNQQWVHVAAHFGQENWFEYEGEGPVLYAESVRPAAPGKLVIGIN